MKYYIAKMTGGGFVIRQDRFRADLKAGRPHPHDICAFANTADGIKRMAAEHFPNTATDIEEGISK